MRVDLDADVAPIAIKRSFAGVSRLQLGDLTCYLLLQKGNRRVYRGLHLDAQFLANPAECLFDLFFTWEHMSQRRLRLSVSTVQPKRETSYNFG